MRVRLKGIAKTRKKLASGEVATYWYAWRGGPRLAGKPGQPEFVASYNAAAASVRRLSKDTLASLLDQYQNSPAFGQLAAPTRRDYRRHLASISAKFGDCPIALLDDKRIRGDFLEWRDELAHKAPRAADYVFSVFARVLSWAKDRGIIAANPLERHGRSWNGSRAEFVWSEDDERRLLAVASPQMTLAYMLALWTGQRQGDLLTLRWSAYNGEVIKLKQSKTKRNVVIPVAAPLKSMLDRTPRVAETIITTAEGRPYTSNGFRASWRKTAQKAGIAGLTFHDIRGTTVTLMALEETPISHIATITGHSIGAVQSILDAHYIKRDDEMGKIAIANLEKRKKSANQAANQSSKNSPPTIDIGNLLDKSESFDGGRTRARTLDPLIKSQLLYQLSYAPIESGGRSAAARPGM